MKRSRFTAAIWPTGSPAKRKVDARTGLNSLHSMQSSQSQHTPIQHGAKQHHGAEKPRNRTVG